MIMMENIARIPKHNILACYDMKGSTYDREVLTRSEGIRMNSTYGSSTVILRSKILKDLDFINRE